MEDNIVRIDVEMYIKELAERIQSEAAEHILYIDYIYQTWPLWKRKLFDQEVEAHLIEFKLKDE